MKMIEVEIRGTAPLLVHRFTEEAEQKDPHRHVVVGPRNPREEATKAAYIDPKDGTFYFNAASIPNCMANAGSAHKMRGSRKSLRFIVPSAVRVVGETITILNGDGPAKDFEVDARPVTIPATKGRIMRYRPRWNEWGAKFTLGIDERSMDAATTQLLLDEGGQFYGVGDYRPEKRGPFGTFRVTLFKEV